MYPANFIVVSKDTWIKNHQYTQMTIKSGLHKSTISFRKCNKNLKYIDTDQKYE